MTEEELRIWCDAQGMSYPGSLPALLEALIKRVGAEAAKAMTARQDMASLQHDIGLALGDVGDPTLPLVPRIGAYVASIQNNDLARAAGKGDAEFLEGIASPDRLGAIDRMSDGELAHLAGGTQAELVARRVARKMATSISGGIFKEEE